ncbi:recombination mediator RecR [Elstera litoralis]|uniref:recombination mediator RecR n=1 Tax=Elstera litoralis TaxID=552518 RepID=UPI001E2B9C15|nr:recombination mediator RecR [Elstera litoralis]
MALLARLPGLGPRSARRAALHLLKRRDALMIPLADAISETARTIKTCTVCGTLDSSDPCRICSDETRAHGPICIVEQVGDLWAIERTGSFHGRYHVLGGTLSALEGVGPEALGVPRLLARLKEGGVSEVILALNATLDGQTTAYYLTEVLADSGVKLTRLAHGVPVGGELDYLDDGTLMAAFSARRSVETP